jgi:hypothetical protein
LVGHHTIVREVPEVRSKGAGNEIIHFVSKISPKADIVKLTLPSTSPTKAITTILAQIQ